MVSFLLSKKQKDFLFLHTNNGRRTINTKGRVKDGIILKICVTGHSPQKLYGYDLNNEYWLKLKDTFKRILKEQNCHEAITGMTLGTDIIFALAVLELRDEEQFPIQLHCAIPCRNQDDKWPLVSKVLYQSIIDKADIIHYVTDTGYTPSCMQKRNKYMVDHADKVIAVWDGSSGGTGNCVNYAISLHKDIIRISP